MKILGKIIKTKPSRDGFTLVEALVSAFIMVIVLGSSIVAVNAALRRVAAAEAKMEAMHEARNQMEALRSLAFEDPKLAVGTQSIYQNGNPTGTYQVAIEATDVKSISLDIFWADPLTGSVRTVNLVTKITKPLH